MMKIIAIDPSSSHLGWSLLNLDEKNKKIYVEKLGQIDASILAKKKDPKLFKAHTQVITLLTLEDELQKLFSETQPNYVVSESSFMARFPTAYVSLSLCIYTIRRLLYVNFNLPLYTVAPKQAKKVVAEGSASKEEVQHAIKKLKDLVWDNQNNELELTEHMADSVAIGYTFIKGMLLK